MAGIALAAILALVLAVGMPSRSTVAWADETNGSGQSSQDAGSDQSGQSGTSGQITVNDSIIDTGNLLGSKLSEVMDSVSQVKEKTGATLRLMYLPHLDTQGDAEAWCRQVLDTSGAAPNTVLLAVASQDGNLVSCVSADSDDWLNNHVQDFADAALGPITGNEDPDWGGAAIALANKIIEAKDTSASRGVVMVGVAAVVGVLIILVVVGIVFHRIRRKRRRRHAGARARGKSSGHRGRRSAARNGRDLGDDAVRNGGDGHALVNDGADGRDESAGKETDKETEALRSDALDGSAAPADASAEAPMAPSADPRGGIPSADGSGATAAGGSAIDAALPGADGQSTPRSDHSMGFDAAGEGTDEVPGAAIAGNDDPLARFRR